MVAGLAKAYAQVRVGDPLDDGTLYGPMHSQQGVDAYKQAVAEAVQQGGKIEYGGKVRAVPGREGSTGLGFVRPGLCRAAFMACLVCAGRLLCFGMRCL